MYPSTDREGDDDDDGGDDADDTIERVGIMSLQNMRASNRDLWAAMTSRRLSREPEGALSH